eukprot:m.205264 g.205264  ORF g.205264 m.205264 type:complete len:151 (-) comp17756_c0_seq2:2748-3200(-)
MAARLSMLLVVAVAVLYLAMSSEAVQGPGMQPDLSSLFKKQVCETKACQSGYVRSRRTGYVTVPNGCFTETLPLKITDLPETTTGCCNEHDHCYDDCSKTKQECDEVFRDCLTKAGSEYADIFFSSVQFFGCPAYKKAQDAACSCEPHEL